MSLQGAVAPDAGRRTPRSAQQGPGHGGLRISSEQAEASAGLVPSPRVPEGPRDQPRFVVARYRTAGPEAVTGAAAGTNAEAPCCRVTSSSPDARTAVPS